MRFWKLTILLLFGVVMTASAQNLVPNPSFEVNTGCPSTGSQINLAFPWQGVTTNSTDYLHTCGTGNYGIPFSGWNYQTARTGNAYAGLWVINSFGYDYREYLQAPLSDSLMPDSCYLVEFYCNIVWDSKWAIRNMGACLSNTAINDVGPMPWSLVLQHTPQVVSQTIISDTAEWTRVAGYYKALGGEKYITIGSFVTDSLTDTLNIGGSYDGAYYFIEDVRVEKISACDTLTSVEEPHAASGIKLFPNPNDGTMKLEYRLAANDQGVLEIHDVTGHLVATYGLNPASTSISFTNNELSNGVYFYRLNVNGKIMHSDKLVIVK